MLQPEFIALGQVIKDMLNPDFILIGSNTEESAKSLAEIYKQVNGDNVLIKYMGIAEAEIVKISINTFLTLKISFANTVGLLCNSHDDVDPAVVADAIGADTVLGRNILNPGLVSVDRVYPATRELLLRLSLPRDSF